MEDNKQELVTEKLEDVYNFRKYNNILDLLVKTIAISWTIFQVYTSVFGLFPSLIQRPLTLGFGVVLAFLCYRTKFSKNDKNKLPIYDLIFIILSIICITYPIINFKALASRAAAPISSDIILGTIAILIVLEATRRSIGKPLVIVAIVFILYGFLGPYMPIIIGHRGYSITRIAEHLFLTTEGIFGVPLYVMSTYIYAFILFGAFLQSTGGAKYFITLAYALTGASKGGPAKTAVVASGLMGTISGSSLANVVTTGSFTIPLMKKLGYKPSFAGGVEAAASSGGQIMPPVMGAAAFIMVEMTGIPYLQIIKASFIPATLYFISIFIMVHFEAVRLDLKAIPRKDLPDIKESIKNSLPLLIPIFTIIFLLIVGFSPLKAALYSAITMIIMVSFKKETRLSIKDILRTFELAAYNSIAITAACAVCGIIIGIVSLTGVGLKFSQIILTISGNNLFITLLLTMITSIILGMGLPTTAKYIVLATIAAPVLVKLGVPLIAAHLFIFYYGVVAEVTPPVALTSYAAAAIAGSPSVETAFNGLRLSFAAFLVPFLFIYNPKLLMYNVSFIPLMLTIVTSLVGILCLGVGLGGYFITNCKWYERGLLVFASVSLIFHGVATDLTGIVILAIIYFIQKKRKQREVAIALS